MANDASELEDVTEDTDESDAGIGIVRARTILGELVLRSGYGNERIALTRKGKPLAFLIGLKDMERLKSLDAERAA